MVSRRTQIAHKNAKQPRKCWELEGSCPRFFLKWSKPVAELLHFSSDPNYLRHNPLRVLLRIVSWFGSQSVAYLVVKSFSRGRC